MLKLTYLPANAAYAFTFGDSLIRMEDASGPLPLLFSVRADAVRAAASCGLRVKADRSLEVMESAS